MSPDDDWVGLRRGRRGHELVFGDGHGGVRMSRSAAHRADLVALAIAYFEGSFDDPPPELEATQHDIADLVRWLTETEPVSATAWLLREAVESIDDGLAGDVVIGRLGLALAAVDPEDQTEPVVRLWDRYRSVLG